MLKMIKLPEKMPPSIIALFFLCLGFALGYFYCLKSAGQNEADQLASDSEFMADYNKDREERIEQDRNDEDQRNETLDKIGCLDMDKPVIDSLHRAENKQAGRQPDGADGGAAQPDDPEKLSTRVHQWLQSLSF